MEENKKGRLLDNIQIQNHFGDCNHLKNLTYKDLNEFIISFMKVNK